MKLAFTLHSVALAAYGLGLLLIPDTFLGLYGVSLSPGAAIAIRFFGGVATGNALLSWWARNQPPSELLKIVVLVFAFDWLATFVAGLLGQFANAMNPLGWSTVVLAAAWASVFGYLRFAKA